MIKQDR